MLLHLYMSSRMGFLAGILPWNHIEDNLAHFVRDFFWYCFSLSRFSRLVLYSMGLRNWGTMLFYLFSCGYED